MRLSSTPGSFRSSITDRSRSVAGSREAMASRRLIMSVSAPTARPTPARGRNGRTGGEKGDDQNQEGGDESHDPDVLPLGELEPVDDVVQEVGEPRFDVTPQVGRHRRLRATQSVSVQKAVLSASWLLSSAMSRPRWSHRPPP